MMIIAMACFVAGQIPMTGAMRWSNPSGITIQEVVTSGTISCKDLGVNSQSALVDAPDSAMDCYPRAIEPPAGWGNVKAPKKGASMWLSPMRWQHFVKLQCATVDNGQTLLALKTR